MADNEKLGSTSPQVLLKNAINLDKLVNDRESESLPDRFDVLRRTWFGMEKAHDRQMQSQENRFDTFIASSGYEVIGDYTAGPLTLTEYNQLIRYNNELYKLTAATDIPYTTAGTTDETWNATDSLHFVSVGDAALRQELSFSDGLKMIGECSYLSILRSVEPQFDGQQISLTAGHTGWSANASGMPWGGGKFRYIANLPAELQMDDGGSIIKTVGGKCWVREELLTGIGEIRVEWYLNAAPSFTDDASDAFQAAADTAKLWAQYSGRNSTVRLVMPPKMYITKTINVYSRGVRIDGNHGYCQVSASGTYTAYNTLSTNANITASPDGGATVVAVINLTHGAGGPGVANPAYSDQELVKDWNLTLGGAGAGYNVLPLADNGITAFCHWGTSTVAASQFSFRNVSTQGFGVGYINGDNTWGGDFYECKWVGCYIPMWLINGADNSERYTLFGCVMQNGYRCVYSPWGGDFNIVKGSYVWNTGPYFDFPTASNMIEINPSRIEMVNTSKPLLKVATAIETGATSQTFPLVKLGGGMILLDASTVQPANYLFSVSKYSKLIVADNTWSNKNMTNLANLKLLNPADTGGKVLFRNNTMRVGIFSEFARDNRLLTSTTPAGRLDTITLGGANAANATVSTSGANLTLTVNTTATGTMTLLLKVPVDIDMTDWDSFSWKAVFNNRSLTSAWSVNAFANVEGSNYINNRLDLGSVSLNDAADITDVSSNNSYGYRRIQKRADGGWDRVPTAFYLYFSSTSQTAGDTFTINRLGLLGY
ncbi:hypothetical protein [Klebsiella pneumoniae]|uniref:hypothetical protein n=1 Tax=Klebsiella pneumoniae TaxID=573 RepID=UPI0015D8C3C1|nr:hypothetical protein [Klebsiella pneumoniae]MBG9420547.1 hypothetical protein [Klebsiella pneumoniae]MCP6665450.1 hypothetical protein [Klebsiella pneumoniae]MEA4360772.1 hypothetical protein [Klebsiella pneumoniae]HBX5711414.1 hypothetical protein [Klebsiella pneumoniae]